MKDNSVYVIAEAGVNHNGDKEIAFALVDAAASAGADAVKFQTFQAERLASPRAPKASYQNVSTDVNESQLDMLKRLELPKDWHLELIQHCRIRGIEFLSTAFDFDSLIFLDKIGVPRFKIPSGELVNSPLLWAFANTKKPLILSTGMAFLSEVEEALAVISHGLHFDTEPKSLEDVWHAWSDYSYRSALSGHVTLLHCTSRYPTPTHQVNLRAMDTLASAFGLRVGYSDHTEGILIPVAAVARGASVIEKHFTLDRDLPGPDHKASLEPGELKAMVSQIRLLQESFGDGVKAPYPEEWDTRRAARQQVVAANEIAEGAVLRREDLRTSRCGAGMSPGTLWARVGTSARQAYRTGDCIV